MKNWDWEDVWMGFLLTLAVAIAVVVGVFTFAPKRVDGYYISATESNGVATCVYAHWTWHNDEKAFCTDDRDRALDFAAKANALVK